MRSRQDRLRGRGVDVILHELKHCGGKHQALLKVSSTRKSSNRGELADKAQSLPRRYLGLRGSSWGGHGDQGPILIMRYTCESRGAAWTGTELFSTDRQRKINYQIILEMPV